MEINEKDLKDVGSNLKAAKVGHLLVLVIDLDVTVGPSSSGKMMGVGKTDGGFAKLPGDVSGNIWVGRKV